MLQTNAISNNHDLNSIKKNNSEYKIKLEDLPHDPD